MGRERSRSADDTLIQLTKEIHTGEPAVGRAESDCKVLCSDITNVTACAVERKMSGKRGLLSPSRHLFTSSAIRTPHVELSELTVRRLNGLCKSNGSIFLDVIDCGREMGDEGCGGHVDPSCNGSALQTKHRNPCLQTRADSRAHSHLTNSTLATDNLGIEVRWRVHGHLHR